MSLLACLHDFTQDLAGAKHLGEVSQIITERGMLIFSASAACTYVRRSDDRLEMLAERGCTPRFISEWRFIPPGMLSLAMEGEPGEIFLGPPAAFKADSPGSDEIVDQSGRQLIAYAPLRAARELVGLFGFSYDEVPSLPPDPDFTKAFAGVASLALTRFYVPSSGSRLAVVHRN